jgi:hypothetical protein
MSHSMAPSLHMLVLAWWEEQGKHMSIAIRLRRAAVTAYSPHPVARLYRAWRRFAGGTSIADIALLPLAGLTLSLFVIELVPNAGEIIAATVGQAWGP